MQMSFVACRMDICRRKLASRSGLRRHGSRPGNENMIVIRVLVVLAAIGAAPLIGQHRKSPIFESYRVKVFSGAPAAPAIAGEYEERYRQQIVDGVVRGDGVLRNGIEQPGVNFAGRYIVIQMSAGAPGLRMVIVDAITGKIIYPPISIQGVGGRSFDLPLLLGSTALPEIRSWSSGQTVG